MAEKKPKEGGGSSTKKCGVRIASCNCKNEFQDKMYGPGQRVFSIGIKKGDKCSVCSSRKV